MLQRASSADPRTSSRVPYTRFVDWEKAPCYLFISSFLERSGEIFRRIAKSEMRMEKFFNLMGAERSMEFASYGEVGWTERKEIFKGEVRKKKS